MIGRCEGESTTLFVMRLSKGRVLPLSLHMTKASGDTQNSGRVYTQYIRTMLLDRVRML